MTNNHVSAEPFKFTITDNFNSSSINVRLLDYFSNQERKLHDWKVGITIRISP